MKKFEVKDHEPSLLPDGKWKLVWADEFDGTELDRTKWNFRLNYWGERFPAYTDQGVVLDGNSHVELHRTEIDGKYVSPQLQTGANSFDHLTDQKTSPWQQDGIWPFEPFEAPKFVHRYGYYECRCKFQKDPYTMWSAFWLQSPSIGARFEPEWAGVECDIMEHFKSGMATSGNIYGGYGPQFTKDGRIKYEIEEEGWHYFGMEWTPDEYIFYCDGKETTRCNAAVSHVPEFILLTTEVQGYRSIKNGKYRLLGHGCFVDEPPFEIKGEYEDDAFICDFVRVFDRVEE